jgi:hypothetical protein
MTQPMIAVPSRSASARATASSPHAGKPVTGDRIRGQLSIPEMEAIVLDRFTWIG